MVDARSVRPASDLRISQVFDLNAGFLARADHPLVQRGLPVTIDDALAYPIASTPLSEEVARILISRYGPQANPDDMVTLRSDETMSLVDVARQGDAIVLTANAAAPGLVSLPMAPPLAATARFGMVTLAQRQEAPAVRILREWLANWIGEIESA